MCVTLVIYQESVNRSFERARCFHVMSINPKSCNKVLRNGDNFNRRHDVTSEKPLMFFYTAWTASNISRINMPPSVKTVSDVIICLLQNEGKMSNAPLHEKANKGDRKWEWKKVNNWTGSIERLTAAYFRPMLTCQERKPANQKINTVLTYPIFVLYTKTICFQACFIHSWKLTRCTISQIYLIKYSPCFGQVHCPSSGVSQHSTFIHAIGVCHASSVGVC